LGLDVLFMALETYKDLKVWQKAEGEEKKRR
jgi:hypothetical protein